MEEVEFEKEIEFNGVSALYLKCRINTLWSSQRSSPVVSTQVLD